MNNKKVSTKKQTTIATGYVECKFCYAKFDDNAIALHRADWNEPSTHVSKLPCPKCNTRGSLSVVLAYRFNDRASFFNANDQTFANDYYREHKTR